MRAGEVRQVGTPEDLYARPAHADVAEFMGYRNLIRARATKAGSALDLTFGGVTVQGTPVDAKGEGEVIAAVRPDDLEVSANGPIEVTVISALYHGSDFYCSGKTADGTDIYFRTRSKVQKDDKVRLGADARRVLVYSKALS